MKTIGLLINAYDEVLIIQDRQGVCSFPTIDTWQEKVELFGVPIAIEQVPYSQSDTRVNYLATIIEGKAKYDGDGRIYWLPVDLFSDVEWEEKDESTRLLLQKEGLEKNL